MTPADIIAARAALGRMRGLDRPLRRTELARALRTTDDTVKNWERGISTMPGPATVALEALLAGYEPGKKD